MGQDAPPAPLLPTESQKEDAAPIEDMDSRSQKFRAATPEPAIFTTGSHAQWMGLYFGAGFRQVEFTFQSNRKVEDKDGTANGIGFNLGYFFEEQAYEFSRQVSLIDLNTPLVYEGRSWEQVEVQQNNFSFLGFPKITSKLYAHYGAGIQFAQIRPSRSESFIDETGVLFSVGGSFFVTPSLMLLYRLSHSFFLPINKNRDDALLSESQLQTLFLEYYFPL